MGISYVIIITGCYSVFKLLSNLKFRANGLHNDGRIETANSEISTINFAAKIGKFV